MSRFTQWMDDHVYPNADQWDVHRFRDHILRHLTPDSVVLDFGAGRGRVRQLNFRGMCAQVCGCDLDPIVLQNPCLDDARVMISHRIPFDSDTFDLIICNSVLEHVSRPAAVMDEIFRVLKPGGVFIAKTPNRRHYMAVIARHTPHRFHEWVNRKRGRENGDTFPTLYLMNTRDDVHRSLPRGLEIADVQMISHRPEYLRFCAPAYVLGWLYERMVNSTPALARFRAVMIVTVQRSTVHSSSPRTLALSSV